MDRLDYTSPSPDIIPIPTLTIITYPCLTVTHTLVPTAALLILWLLLSGHYGLLLTSAGLVCSLGIAAFAARLGVMNPAERPFMFHVRALGYLPWLTREIIKSNVDVTRRIWNPKLPISPTIIFVRASQRTDLGIAVHANSITLTPGTLSIDTAEGEIEVHALATDIAEGLVSSDMDRRVRALEGKD